MIMGADVNHPPAGDGESPSIAAVVSSVDRHASRFCTEVRTQEHRVEIIQELKLMTKNLLMAFYKKNMKRKPERIIMYRDGVSESQFHEVLAYEMMAMRSACTELEQSFEPGITFIVVQKRHHTRLFCNERQGVGKCLNIPPGTVVDSSITHPKERDFYLCSHQGIQGTSKPTHYHVLWDDNNFSMDHLQELTYNMCHLYNRCMRSVSLPNAAYYAHLAAYRAKIHITNTDHDAEKPTQEELKKSAMVDLNKPISDKFYYV